MTESLLDQVVAVRTDLEWSSRIVGCRRRWIAHDPISSAFFYFSDTEYSILQRFDGRKRLREIIGSGSDLLNGELGIPSWNLQTWSRFLRRMDQASLLSSDRPGVSHQRWESIERNRQQNNKQRWLSLLAIRWRWGDPTRWLSLFEPLERLLFRRDVFACFAIVSLLVWFSVVLRLWETPNALLRADDLLQGSRWLGILVAYVSAKLFHELGHLLAARRFGAGCREVGIVWLCFVPCFYCDTTDSWRIEDPKKRATIAAAGIYFEWIIATVAAWLWLNSSSSGLHAGAANLMLVCSIGTILINANPLVRYDGYYILSDLWGVPNLADQGREALFELIATGFTGEPMGRDRWDASPAALIVYGVLSFIYRSLLLIAVVWGLWWFLEPRGLGLAAFFFNRKRCRRCSPSMLNGYHSTAEPTAFQYRCMACLGSPRCCGGLFRLRRILADEIVCRRSSRYSLRRSTGSFCPVGCNASIAHADRRRYR